MSCHADQNTPQQPTTQQPTVATQGVHNPFPVPLTLLSTYMNTGGDKESDAPVDAAAFLREAGFQDIVPACLPASDRAPAPDDSKTATKRSKMSSAAAF
jgi:hypothetical protein